MIKKFVPYILIAVILVQLFAPFTVGMGEKNNLVVGANKVEAWSSCKIDNVSFSPTLGFNAPNPGKINLIIDTSGGCSENFLLGNLKNADAQEILDFGLLKITGDQITIELNTSENFCNKNNNSCFVSAHFVIVGIQGDVVDKIGFISSYDSKTTNGNDVLNFECTKGASGNPACDTTKPWSIEVGTGVTVYNTFSINNSVNDTSIAVYGLGPLDFKVNNSPIKLTDNLIISAYKNGETNPAVTPITKSIAELVALPISGKKDIENAVIYNQVINGLTPDTLYSVKITINNKVVADTGPVVKTLPSGQQTFVYAPKTSISNNIGAQEASEVDMPSCSAMFWTTIGGCLGQILYKLVFRPSSALFAITGKLLDVSIGYSIKDTSYRSMFVVEGWKLVKDFCNMFFIFILLYIAFSTILNINSAKTKEMIINVVIIGLLINFSLFATQVIIDASNVLTRVFYNESALVVGEKGLNGKVVSQPGKFGEIRLSEAIVTKIGPQKLITDAAKVGTSTNASGDEIKNGVTAGTFILMVILASAVNIVGLIVFLSASLIFITRVIGLWIAMILAPIAFFSYTVPAMQGWETIGWKRWWPETMKMAFLAPVFLFFMYLVIKFLGIMSIAVFDADSKSGMDFVVAIMIPFVLVMVLMWKAKDIAKEMSGKMGQSITNGMMALGGVALGGAALGSAALLRGTVGRTMAKASRGDTSTQKYQAAIGNPTAMAKLSAWEKLKGSAGSKVGLGKIYGKDKGTIDPATGKPIGVESGLGGILNKKQREVGKIDRARHDEDEIMKAAGLEGKDSNKLSYEDINNMENKFNQTNRSDAENAAKKGVDAKGENVFLDEGTPDQVRGQEEFKSKHRASEETALVAAATAGAPGTAGDVDAATGKLSKVGEKKLENELNIKLNAAIKVAADKKLATDFIEMRGDAAKHVNPVSRAISGSNKSSYDVRNLANLKSDKREGLLSKIPIGFIAAVTTGVRSGIKGIGMSNGGIKVEGNFMKDLGNTISDSLKSMKVNVDLSHVGETKSSANAHGGGEHH